MDKDETKAIGKGFLYRSLMTAKEKPEELARLFAKCECNNLTKDEQTSCREGVEEAFKDYKKTGIIKKKW